MIDITVILSTYNSPLWLQKVLWGYEKQSFKNFELIIADDGSTESTFHLIKMMKKELSYPIKHVWHKDNGFQKTIILNKAIIASNSNYLLFSDGDCIPRLDFIKAHIDNRKENIFLSGGYFKLPLNISKLITKSNIEKQLCFNLKWLYQNGLNYSVKNIKLTKYNFIKKIFNYFTTTKATWNGHNSSAWKKDIIKANGFDERMQYGGEDRELGERLFNLKIRSKQIRYIAICQHLDHPRNYVRQEMIEKNLLIRKYTKTHKVKKTTFGIIKI